MHTLRKEGIFTVIGEGARSDSQSSPTPSPHWSAAALGQSAIWARVCLFMWDPSFLAMLLPPTEIYFLHCILTPSSPVWMTSWVIVLLGGL